MGINSIITGSDIPLRKTRFHDEKGNLVSFKYFIKHAPRAFSSMIALKLFGIRPEKPWLSYAAIKLIDKFLDKNKTVLEFGSGMSTIWLARKSNYVYSVEDFEPWFNNVQRLIKKYKISNVDYNLKNGAEYYSYTKKNKVNFDFILIDGFAREKCAEYAIEVIKPNGMIYLDNSDKDSSDKYTKDETRQAENILLEFARSHNAEVTYFSDFAPTAFFVQQGMMIKFN